MRKNRSGAVVNHRGEPAPICVLIRSSIRSFEINLGVVNMCPFPGAVGTFRETGSRRWLIPILKFASCSGTFTEKSLGSYVAKGYDPTVRIEVAIRQPLLNRFLPEQ